MYRDNTNYKRRPEMAKITFDPLVQSISNGLGNFVYATRDDKGYIRKRPRKAAWVTPSQTRHRQLFGSAAGAWKAVSDAIRKSWTLQRTSAGVNEFNIFMAQNMPRLKSGEPMILTHGSGLDAPAVSAASGTAGEIALSYTAGATPQLLSVYLQGIGENGRIVFTQAAADSPQTHISLADLPSGSEAIVYCVFSDKPMADASRISASQSLRVTVK